MYNVNDKRYVDHNGFHVFDTDCIDNNSSDDEDSDNNYQEIFLSGTRSPSPPPSSSRKGTINPFKYIFLFTIYWMFWSFVIKNNNFKII